MDEDFEKKSFKTRERERERERGGVIQTRWWRWKYILWLMHRTVEASIHRHFSTETCRRRTAESTGKLLQPLTLYECVLNDVIYDCSQSSRCNGVFKYYSYIRTDRNMLTLWLDTGPQFYVAFRSPVTSQYETDAGQLSLAIPQWVGAMSTSQRAVMSCGRGVKAGMVREWVAAVADPGGCGRIPLSSDKNFLNDYILGIVEKRRIRSGCRLAS